MSRVRNALVAGAVLLLGRGRPKLVERERIVPPKPGEGGAELAAIALLAAGALCAIAFPVIYALDTLPRHTQLLGASLGLAFLFVGAALIVTARRLIVTEELEEDYPATEYPEEQETIVQLVEESGGGITRRGLFKLALAGAGGALGIALITPAASLGPVLDIGPYFKTPWRRGRRLVDEQGRPYRADEIEEKSFYTAFAEGGDKEEMASSVVLVRLAQNQLDLPPDLAHYPARGIVAYSKICTHAGCAISLYRSPLFAGDEPKKPALVCPCHYSTFDVGNGGEVLFGPAGRKLPMLPIYVDGAGELRAAGNFDEAVGPSWWGVRNRKPTT